MRTVALILVMLVGLAARASADDESDKIGEIRDLLDAIASDLDGIAGRSSPDAIDSAIDRASKVKDLAERLRSPAPTSDDGKTIASSYRDWASKFIESAKALKDMKRAQLDQAQQRLTERCNEAQLKLRADIARFVERKDPEGAKQVPDLAERVAGSFRDELRRMDDANRELERQKGYARNFSETHGRWSNVKSRLYDGVDGIADAWKRRYDETHGKCDDPVRGKDNPIVQDGLKQLMTSDELRRGLVSDIAARLAEAAAALDRVLGDSSPSYASEAINKLDAAKELLGRLNNAKGEDGEARRIAERWPSYVDRAKQACVYLGDLKRNQTRADRAPDRCREQIDARGAALARDHRGAGREAIALARDIGVDLRARLDAARTMTGENTNLRSKVREFSEREGPWEAVSRKLGSTADGILDYWNKAVATANEKCEDVAKGEASEKFLARLEGKCTKNEQKELDKPVDRACKQSGPRTCKVDAVAPRDCATLRARLEVNKQCKAARVDLNEWCYDGGDRGHRDQVDDTQKTIEGCEARISAEC